MKWNAPSWLNAHCPVVVLTGAGISKESGLSTFRDVDGEWSKERVEDVATPEGWARDPRVVQNFYNARRARLLAPEVQPHAAHLAIAEWERFWEGPYLLVTQNIDDLHERAGSAKLLHLHGELLKARCAACGRLVEVRGPLGLEAACGCGPGGVWRPHVVWFGEMPLYLDEIMGALQRCRMFVSIGTSGSVYPAAGFVSVAAAAGAWCVELNLEESQVSGAFDLSLRGAASELVPEFVGWLGEVCNKAL